MSAVPIWSDCALMLQAVLNGAKADDQDREVLTHAVIAGLIINQEQMQPCKTCGIPRVNFRYWRVTAAGRMLVEALEARTPSDIDQLSPSPTHRALFDEGGECNCRRRSDPDQIEHEASCTVVDGKGRVDG